MPHFAYVNGRYTQHSQAAIHIEDRGFQFADGVYEVLPVRMNSIIDEEAHYDRLNYSLGELDISWPMSRAAMKLVTHELMRKNRFHSGLVYQQITRGAAPRNHAFPDPLDIAPTLVMTTKALDFYATRKFSDGVSVITVPDIRWKRRDIKTVSLLGNCMAKTRASKAGAYEAWQFEDGFITEGTSSNAWIINEAGEIITRTPGNEILNGITRMTIMRLAKERGYKIIERPFAIDEAYKAREAFASSATSFVTPVVKIDDHKINNGKPGDFCRDLLRIYQEYIGGAS